MLALFAALEATFAFCVGCRLFALLIAAHLLPGSICESCNDLALRPARASVA